MDLADDGHLRLGVVIHDASIVVPITVHVDRSLDPLLCCVGPAVAPATFLRGPLETALLATASLKMVGRELLEQAVLGADDLHSVSGSSVTRGRVFVSVTVDPASSLHPALLGGVERVLCCDVSAQRAAFAPAHMAPRRGFERPMLTAHDGDRRRALYVVHHRVVVSVSVDCACLLDELISRETAPHGSSVTRNGLRCTRLGPKCRRGPAGHCWASARLNRQNLGDGIRPAQTRRYPRDTSTSGARMR